MRKPNFLVIGAQKSGTTWLYRFLQSRPDVFVPHTRKELMFFDVGHRYRALGIEGYLAYFADAREEVAVGEVTPGYLWSSREHTEWGPPSTFRRKNPERVRSHLGPDVKLIAVLRNPVERALSAFLHHRQNKRIPRQDGIASWLPRHGIAHLGFYGAHLARWREVFAERNFFVATYEELFARPTVHTAVLDFLGAEPTDARGFAQEKVSPGIGFSRAGDAVFDAKGHRIASINDIETLRNIYRDDVRRLAREWRVDIRWWRTDFPDYTERPK